VDAKYRQFLAAKLVADIAQNVDIMLVAGTHFAVSFPGSWP
jgi:hypothetical protein